MSAPTPIPTSDDKTNGSPQNPTLATASQPMTPTLTGSTPIMLDNGPTAMGNSQAWAQPAQPVQYSQGSTPYGQAPYSQPTYGRTPTRQDAPQAPYNQPAYGQPATTQPPYAQPMEGQYSTSSQALVERLHSNSMVCLTLGILGLVMIGLFGPISAWIWGNSIIREAMADGIPEDYVSSAKIGRILGLVRTWIWTIAVVLSILFFAGTIMFDIAAGASGYWSCAPRFTQNHIESPRFSSEAGGFSHKPGAPELPCSGIPLC